jgi:hypothetical protein
MRTSGQGSTKRKTLLLTVPVDLSYDAFAKLSSWVYVRVGTRPHDLSEVASAILRHREGLDAIRVDNAWTSRDFEFIVGRMVRAEFLGGVGSICAATGARWEWRVRRNGLIRTTVVTVSGPGHVVQKTAGQLLEWQRLFPAQGGG